MDRAGAPPPGRRGALAAAALVALTLGGCTPPQSPPLRLASVDEPVRAEVARVRGGRQIEIEAAGFGGPLGGQELRRVVMFSGEHGRDFRQSIFAPTPSSYSFRLRPPAGEPVLETALGYVILPEDAGARVRFRIEVAPAGGGEPQVAFTEVLHTSAHDEWRRREIPLSAWAGQDVELTLTTRGGGRESPQVLAAWAAPRIRVPAAAQDMARRPNLILISLDTVRADRLGCYGYERPTSPRLDAFAGRSIRFETAVSQSSWTRPSHESLFSGLYPLSRGGRESPPLAARLWQEGFTTAAITADGQLDPAFGFAVGFESYAAHYRWLRDISPAVSWLEAAPPVPFFLFLHTYEPHSPYEFTELAEGLDPGRARPGFNSKQHRRLKRRLSSAEKRYVEALYDSDIRFTDRKLGELLETIERLGLLEDTIVVILSDHGEEFWEHGGWGHGKPPHEHQVRVPLIVHLPPPVQRQHGLRVQPGVVAQPVQLVDLYPTLLELLGLPPSQAVQGRSLLPLLRGDKVPPRDAFSEATRLKHWEVKSLRNRRYKLLSYYPMEPGAEPARQLLYDLANDPGEGIDLAAERPELVALLQRQLDRFLSADSTAGYAPEDPDALDPELRRQLEALGYIGN